MSSGGRAAQQSRVRKDHRKRRSREDTQARHAPQLEVLATFVPVPLAAHQVHRSLAASPLQLGGELHHLWVQLEPTRVARAGCGALQGAEQMLHARKRPPDAKNRVGPAPCSMARLPPDAEGGATLQSGRG